MILPKVSTFGWQYHHLVKSINFLIWSKVLPFGCEYHLFDLITTSIGYWELRSHAYILVIIIIVKSINIRLRVSTFWFDHNFNWYRLSILICLLIIIMIIQKLSMFGWQYHHLVKSITIWSKVLPFGCEYWHFDLISTSIDICCRDSHPYTLVIIIIVSKVWQWAGNTWDMCKGKVRKLNAALDVHW